MTNLNRMLSTVVVTGPYRARASYTQANAVDLKYAPWRKTWGNHCMIRTSELFRYFFLSKCRFLLQAKAFNYGFQLIDTTALPFHCTSQIADPPPTIIHFVVVRRRQSSLSNLLLLGAGYYASLSTA